MLKKIYIDNFRCFVNFSLSLDSVNLLLGENGTGKSSIFDLLKKLQSFIRGEAKLQTLFSPSEWTRWQSLPVQSFELEAEGNGGIYRYELAIGYEAEDERLHIRQERLFFNEQPLVSFVQGVLQLYQEDGSGGPMFPLGESQSALALIQEKAEPSKLAWFKRYITDRLLIFKINPIEMGSESQVEQRHPSGTLWDFASWYRYISQDQGRAIAINRVLHEVMEGFEYFRFVEAGENRKVLKAVFSVDEESDRLLEYRFHELSDGQRSLIVLYTLLELARTSEYLICLDEPENFLALPEIQPWLVELYDLCQEGKAQALLISHHPQLIDYLAVSSGFWFERAGNRPVRLKPIAEDESGLSVSELVARGWLHGET